MVLFEADGALSPDSIGVVSFVLAEIISAAMASLEAFVRKLPRGVIELTSSLWLPEAVEAAAMAAIAGGAEEDNLWYCFSVAGEKKCIKVKRRAGG